MPLVAQHLHRCKYLVSIEATQHLHMSKYVTCFRQELHETAYYRRCAGMHYVDDMLIKCYRICKIPLVAVVYSWGPWPGPLMGEKSLFAIKKYRKTWFPPCFESISGQTSNDPLYKIPNMSLSSWVQSMEEFKKFARL